MVKCGAGQDFVGHFKEQLLRQDVTLVFVFEEFQKPLVK